MKKDIRHIDPELPHGLGNVLSEIENSDRFLVPEKYFEESESHLRSLISIPQNAEHFEVPEPFFENQKNALWQKVIGVGSIEEKSLFTPKTPRKIYRAWLFTGVAASLVLAALFLFSPGKKHTEKTSFASLLEETDLVAEDLEYFAEEDDYYELYLLEIETDTLISDTMLIPADSILVEPVKPAMDPKPTTPKNSKVAPNKDISFEDLTDEEILEYLLEESDDDYWND